MPRAMLIEPNEDPTWIDLDADVRTHLGRLLNGHETVVLDREHGEDGPGVKIAVRESAMTGTDAPNGFAQSIVGSFGQDWPVLGLAVIMWLDGRDVVDLTPEHWSWIVNVESGMVAAPFRPADHLVWFFNGQDEEPSTDAYLTLGDAKAAAIRDYEAGDSGPAAADVAYAWRSLETQRDYWMLDEDGVHTGWSVWPVRVLGSRVS